MAEIRKKIKGYLGYEISNKGNIYSLSKKCSVGKCFGWDKIRHRVRREYKLRPHFIQGYWQVHLSSKPKVHKLFRLHVLLAEAGFLGKKPKYLAKQKIRIIEFKDGDKSNISLKNLKWREESKRSKLNK